MCITDIPAQKKWHFSLRLTSKEGLWRRLSWIIIQQIFTHFVKVDIVPHFQGPKKYYVMCLCALPDFGVDVQLWLGENAVENFDGPIVLCCVFFYTQFVEYLSQGRFCSLRTTNTSED